MAFYYSPKTVTNGLILAFDIANTTSYPGSGTIVTDLARKNTLSLINGASYDSQSGGNITFDGINDAIEAPSTNLLNITGAMTLEAWARVDSGASLQTLITKSELAFGNQFNITYNTGTQLDNATYGDTILTRLSAGSTDFSLRSDINGIVDDGNFHHIVYTWDGTSNTSGVNSYLDNLNNNILIAGTVTSNPLRTNTQTLQIGYGRRFGWFGKIAVVRIYNRGLSEKEVSQNFNANKNRFGL